MRTQEPAGQSAPPHQAAPYSSYAQYPRQAPPQQPPPNSFQQGSYPNPQRQQIDPRLNPQPPSEQQQQQPPAPADWAEGSRGRGPPLDQSQTSGAYGQGHTGRRHVEPVNPPHNMGNEASEFGMGRRGRGGGQNASRGQTPPSSSAAAGTGAASVMALGQNKLPQRAEVPPWWCACICLGGGGGARYQQEGVLV